MAITPAMLLGQTEHFQAKQNVKMRWLTVKIKRKLTIYGHPWPFFWAYNKTKKQSTNSNTES